MTKEELALEFTKIMAPTINANCSASDTVPSNCCEVVGYYKEFLKIITEDEESYLKQ